MDALDSGHIEQVSLYYKTCMLYETVHVGSNTHHTILVAGTKVKH